jgi:hypothetical protein
VAAAAKPVAPATRKAPSRARAAAKAAPVAVAPEPEVVVAPAKRAKGDKKAKATAPAAKPAKARKAAVKEKTVRDSFTFPESDYGLFAALKRRAIDAGVEVKKSELLRAGLRLLAQIDEAGFVASVNGVERVKTGRPKK